MEQDRNRTADVFNENWPGLREAIRKRWSRLHDTDLDQINGKRESLVDALQERYGLTREEAEAKLLAFEEENDDYARAVQKTSAGTAFSPRF